MSQNERQPNVFVYARIPEMKDDSERVLVDWKGRLPHMQHTEGTYEDTLARIGREQLGLKYLSVKARERSGHATRRDDADAHIVYTAKTAAHEVAIGIGLRLDRPQTKQQNALFAAARHLTIKAKESVVNSYYDATIYGNYMPRV